MASLGLRLTTPQPPRLPSSYSAFHLPSSSSSDGASDDDDDGDQPLPFPSALSRRDFLAPDFHAATYLSSLFPSDADTTSAHRHQTLEDLRSELRERSSAISAELLELVNANYTSFLGLGDELKGGEDRVEDVRVALLGFRRGVEDVQSRVKGRRVEVGDVCGELGEVRSGVELGRRMLELDERVAMLEGRLAVESLPRSGKSGSEDEFGLQESEEEEDEEMDEFAGRFVGSSPTKLLFLVRDFVLIERLADSVGGDLPFVKKMEERMTRCRNTILLDLHTATKEARKAGAAGQGRMLRFLAIYRVLGAEAEAVRILKEK